MRRFIRTWLPLAALAASSPLAGGCTATTTGEVSTASASAEPATVAPVAVAAHGHIKAIAEALSTVPLRADQRSEIEALATAAQARMDSTKGTRGALMSAFADQVEQGTIDRTALQPKIDAVTAAFAQSHAADNAAFERLHALLDPTQRTTFADAFEAKAQSRHHGPGPGAHEGHHGPGQELAAWATDLKLTDDQQDQIKAVLAAQLAAHHGEWKGGGHDRGKQMMTAFRSDHFVIAELGAAEPPHADRMTEHMIGIAQSVLPLLTPEQRTLAAAKLRARATEPGPEEQP